MTVVSWFEAVLHPFDFAKKRKKVGSFSSRFDRFTATLLSMGGTAAAAPPASPADISGGSRPEMSAILTAYWVGLEWTGTIQN
jgi:hypothetical protein